MVIGIKAEYASSAWGGLGLSLVVKARPPPRRLCWWRGAAYLAAGTPRSRCLVTGSTGDHLDTMYQPFGGRAGYTQFSVSSVPPHLDLVAYPAVRPAIALLALLRLPDRTPGLPPSPRPWR